MSRLSVISKDPRLRQLFLYALCGGTGVLSDMAVYSLALLNGVGYQLANAAGYAVGTLISFVLNRHFTFQTYDRTLLRLLMFFGMAFIGYLSSSALLWLLVSTLKINPILAKVATLGFVLVLQFSLNRAITFRINTEKK
ncbi:GtrA family protein [Xanthomonas campestris]|uniref:GtrA family protein n=1 Tax=Xanthomonas campestris TaxID=339 RepID=UPI001E44D873|nr:GtrA family protein [Xanthomonas campestris]MCC5070431.1 GtrA family protein [Xanthomonas campestris pv. plantaginis]MCC5083222.1 GtrA family protein [Xanthomonas campestris]MEA9604949.1 GtrA family protein [Xanthomonas campestris pv. plantaginis]